MVPLCWGVISFEWRDKLWVIRQGNPISKGRWSLTIEFEHLDALWRKCNSKCSCERNCWPARWLVEERLPCYRQIFFWEMANRSRLFGHGFWYIPVKKTVEHEIPISEHDQTPSKSIMRKYQIWWIFRNPWHPKSLDQISFPKKSVEEKLHIPQRGTLRKGTLLPGDRIVEFGTCQFCRIPQIHEVFTLRCFLENMYCICSSRKKSLAKNIITSLMQTWGTWATLLCSWPRDCEN